MFNSHAARSLSGITTLALTPTTAAELAFIPEQMRRPLGKGYQDLAAFFSPYLSAARGGTVTTPTLAASLKKISQHPLVGDHLRKLPNDSRCLLQGYSTPDNADATRVFLGQLGIAAPRLCAVDLFDLRAVYTAMGLPQPDMDFHIADATALPRCFRDQHFDLLIQDFLLNCLPPAHHYQLLRETARILVPAGWAIVNFSDASSIRNRPHWTRSQLAKNYGLVWDENAYQLADLKCAPAWKDDLKSRLAGSVVAQNDDHAFAYIVPADGRFEFFPAATHIFSLMEKAGLEPLIVHQHAGVDANGLKCRRHQCLVRKRP